MDALSERDGWVVFFNFEGRRIVEVQFMERMCASVSSSYRRKRSTFRLIRSGYYRKRSPFCHIRSG